MNGKTAWRPCFGALALVAVLAPVVSAQRAGADTYDEIYRRYLVSARATERPDAAIAWMSGLASDPRARGLNDLVTVRVIESISAAGTADSSLSKKGAGSASVAKAFGIEDRLPGFIDPTALAKLSSETSFEGGGSTVRTGELSAVMTARVAEVLPNGDLVLEGAREIDINGDSQIIVLTGVVRPVDITPDNVILSTQIGQLRIRYFGRGLIRDNLKPGWLIRILNKIF